MCFIYNNNNNVIQSNGPAYIIIITIISIVVVVVVVINTVRRYLTEVVPSRLCFVWVVQSIVYFFYVVQPLWLTADRGVSARSTSTTALARYSSFRHPFDGKRLSELPPSRPPTGSVIMWQRSLGHVRRQQAITKAYQWIGLPSGARRSRDVRRWHAVGGEHGHHQSTVPRDLRIEDTVESGDEWEGHVAQRSRPSQIWYGTLRSAHDVPGHHRQVN